MKNKLLAALMLSQVFFVSTSYSKTAEELGLIDKSKHDGISCIRYEVKKCVVYYQTGQCAVEVNYYSNEKSQQPDYKVIEGVTMRVESGVEFGSPDELRDAADFLTDGTSTKVSRAATSMDFSLQKDKMIQYLNSGDSSNNKLPICKD